VTPDESDYERKNKLNELKHHGSDHKI